MLFQPKHPLHHRHPRKPFPGLSSAFTNALAEALESRDMEERSIENLIDRYAPHLRDEWQQIRSLGIENKTANFSLLQIAEAKHLLENRVKAIIALAKREAIAILPLPPHIADSFNFETQDGNVLTADHEVPPHLRHLVLKPVDSLLPTDIQEQFSGIEAVVVEGYAETDALYTRRSAARLIQLLESAGKQISIFVHLMPHRPHFADFVALRSTAVFVI
jgi:hypothetical protein